MTAEVRCLVSDLSSELSVVRSRGHAYVADCADDALAYALVLELWQEPCDLRAEDVTLASGLDQMMDD